MDPDGTVRAMVGGRDYGVSTFNRAVNALRQPGSSFKPYVYAVALENGYTPDDQVLDAPVSIGNWSPQNYGRSYKGYLTLRSALTQSLNTVAVRLSIEFGRQPIADLIGRMGIQTPLRVTRSLALGSSELTVLDQATGYSVFANGGYRVEPRCLVDVAHLDTASVVYDSAADARPLQRVLNETTVLGMIDMLYSVVENGTGRRAQHSRHPRRRQDRHHERLQGCLVCRLHRQLHDGRLARERRLSFDQPADRRHSAGRDLAEIHARRDGVRGGEAASRPAAPGRAPRGAGAWSTQRAIPAFPGGSRRNTAGALHGSRSVSAKRRTRRRCSAGGAGATRHRRPIGHRAIDFHSRCRAVPFARARLWSAWLAVRSPAPIDAIKLGAWQAWPNAGTDDVDPYSRARLARTGEIPLGSGEGLTLLAQNDDLGAPADVACDYRIAGQTPPARLMDARGRGSRRPRHRRSRRARRARQRRAAAHRPTADSRSRFRPIRRPATGSRPKMPSRFRVVVRLYDTTVRTDTALTTLSMPSILRERCA